MGMSAVVVVALVAALFFRWGAASGPDGATSATPTPTPSAEETPTTAEVVGALAPSVVTVQATLDGSTGSLGTGVVVNADGTVLTALHVVDGAKRIRLTFADGTAAEATVAGSDPATDIATLTPQALPEVVVPVVLGGRLAVGDEVIAIGNQLGLIGTTTTGVVSGLNRTARPSDGSDPGGNGSADDPSGDDTGGAGAQELTGLIQFDAAINHGSSGGPLINAQGQVVGIVVALANPTDAETFIGVGFAVPIGAALGSDGEGGPGPEV